MARVTVEDCIEKIPNRFELVMLVAQRARKIGSGAAITLDRDNDKNPVVALREVAAETVQPEDLKEELIRSHQRIFLSQDDEPEDTIDLMDGEIEWAALTARTSEGGFEDAGEDEDASLEDLAGLDDE